MNFESVYGKVTSFFGIKSGSKDFLKKLLKNKEKVKKYVDRQCNTKSITRENIERGINILNASHNNESKKVSLTKFDQETINERKQIHEKAKAAFTEAVVNQYVISNIGVEYGRNVSRGMKAIIGNMSSSPEEAVKIYKLISEYKSTNDINVKNNNRNELKHFFTKSFNKCKESLESFTGIGSDEELIDFYKKNVHVLNTTAELEDIAAFKNIENEFGFTFDNNLGEDFISKYSKFGVEATIICSKVNGMANPLYPEIDLNEIASVSRLFSDPPSEVAFNSPAGRLANELTITDHDKKIKEDLNPLLGYGKVSGNLVPPNYQYFQFGKDVDDDLVYSLQIEKLKNHISFLLNTRETDYKLDNVEFYDKNGNPVNKDDAYMRMVKGESLLMADIIKGNFIMQASSNPIKSYGWLNRNSNIKAPKMKGVDEIIKENDKLLKDYDNLKYKKDHAWFKFTKNRYQKQMDETMIKIAEFKTKYDNNIKENFRKDISDMVNEVNNNVLLVDHDANLFDKFKEEVNNLQAVDPSDSVKFQAQLEKISEASSKYMSAKLESLEFESNENFQKRIDLVCNIKESCYNFKNLRKEFDSKFNEYKEKLLGPESEVKIENTNKKENERQKIEVNELNEDILIQVNNDGEVKTQEIQNEISID